MKKLFLIRVLTSFFLFADLACANVNNQSSPQSIIIVAIQNMIKEVQSKLIKPVDIDQITTIVDKNILQYADFLRTTRLTMGRYWNEATPYQKQLIVELFKRLFIRTYAGAIAQLRFDQKIKYLPFHFRDDDTDVVVRTIINDEKPIRLDYRLYKSPQGGWRVYDINVLGVWLIQTYQQQFKEKIKKSSIDGLICLLSKRNQDLANIDKQSS
ncbi:MAG: ABC transporter substrate-binding protein [Burkholderia sp.]|nr:ABC transporter substrate-binding protein [Burkholderia sp.]